MKSPFPEYQPLPLTRDASLHDIPTFRGRPRFTIPATPSSPRQAFIPTRPGVVNPASNPAITLFAHAINRIVVQSLSFFRI